MKEIHGGDIYRNQVELDFSVNINPLGIPEVVKQALQEAIVTCDTYPDLQMEELRACVSKMLGVGREKLLFGNGASELFMGIVHAYKPKKIVIPVPSFYGYEHAAKASGAEVSFVPVPWEDSHLVVTTLLASLTEGTELLFLANPNNPTGTLLARAEVEEILSHCKEKGIVVVLDECFIEFCHAGHSMIPELSKYPNLLIVRAFTKIFAIPGVRLGYLIGAEDVLGQIQAQLPEWNVSAFAQKAGAACGNLTEYLQETVDKITTERQILTEKLEGLGLRVFPSAADFILFYTEIPLYERLLEKGILIRDCANFRGLQKGYYRVAVKQRKDNERLWKAIGECIEYDRTVVAGGN